MTDRPRLDRFEGHTWSGWQRRVTLVAQALITPAAASPTATAPA